MLGIYLPYPVRPQSPQRKWRETKQQGSSNMSDRRASSCLFSLHFLRGILWPNGVKGIKFPLWQINGPCSVSHLYLCPIIELLSKALSRVSKCNYHLPCQKKTYTECSLFTKSLPQSPQTHTFFVASFCEEEEEVHSITLHTLLTVSEWWLPSCFNGDQSGLLVAWRILETFESSLWNEGGDTDLGFWSLEAFAALFCFSPGTRYSIWNTNTYFCN